MEEFMSGYPPPPFFYRNYSFKEGVSNYFQSEQSQNENSNDIDCDNFDVFDYEKYKLFDGPPAPIPPGDSWYSFGSLRQLVEYTEPLDSVMAIPLDQDEPDARVHFKKLYIEFIEALLMYIRSIKNMDGDYVTHIKTILKLYVNLQHILSSLSERYAEDTVINMLKQQLKERRRYIDCMKVLLVKIKNHLKQHNKDAIIDQQQKHSIQS
ncbi:bifunctional Mediator complex [Babesia duncani]|uniref:Mediator of RNA polymerase II transcription subunit 7 n=1 Tax=Babesia duncani TaxID=323732 RepID=A0AAD9PLY1_9APIC|nr:bifunctional Mediator complex [Babesia duncani]